MQRMNCDSSCIWHPSLFLVILQAEDRQTSCLVKQFRLQMNTRPACGDVEKRVSFDDDPVATCHFCKQDPGRVATPRAVTLDPALLWFVVITSFRPLDHWIRDRLWLRFGVAKSCCSPVLLDCVAACSDALLTSRCALC